ncbi:MAG: tetratricopeptide repeat protein [Candidatus Riflebacteria bacterium]|nr:tetratricopeptide repeat protein [Candidatus Riflebacteria bacterium]
MALLLAAAVGLALAPARPLAAQTAFPTIAEPQTSVRDILTGPQNRPRADTYYLLGLAAARKNNHAEALRQIAIGLRLEPGHLRLLGLRAAIWARQGHTQEAIAEFRRLVRLFPDDDYVRQSLQELERPLRPRFAPVTSALPTPPRRDTPVAPVSTAAPASPKRVLESGYFEEMKQKQRCYFQMAAIRRAQAALAAADPAKKDAFDLQALVDTGHLSAPPVCPGGGTYSWNGAPVCSKHGDFATAEAEVNTVFNDFNRGMQAKIGRNYGAALEAFDQVCAVYPQWSEAHYQRGETLFRLGEDRGAIEGIRRALQCDPGNLDAKLLLANLQFKVGHKESALQLLDEVATEQSGTVYGLSARSLAKSIRSGRNYYQVFPPN